MPEISLEDLKKRAIELADAHCKEIHSDLYNSLICVGPSNLGPPCSDCQQWGWQKATYKMKVDKTQGSLKPIEGWQEFERRIRRNTDDTDD